MSASDRRLVPLLLASLIVLSGGCTLGPQTTPEPIHSSRRPESASTPGTHAASTQQVVVYLIRDARLAPVTRQVPPGVGAVLATLENGPTAAEARRGYQTALPAVRSPMHASIADGVATISVPAGSGRLGVAPQVMAVGQLVYTVTEIDNIQKVQLSNGHIIEVPVSGGALVPGPVGRADYLSIAPK